MEEITRGFFLGSTIVILGEWRPRLLKKIFSMENFGVKDKRYEKPKIIKIFKMDFASELLNTWAKGKKIKYICKQCSQCHSCR